MISKVYTSCSLESNVHTAKRTCPVCGAQFYPKSVQNFICSRTCWEENKFRQQECEQNRPFTSSTVYLIHKYYTEGDSIEEIMEVTGRSRTSVLNALTKELSKKEKDLIARHLILKSPTACLKGGKKI